MGPQSNQRIGASYSDALCNGTSEVESERLLFLDTPHFRPFVSGKMGHGSTFSHPCHVTVRPRTRQHYTAICKISFDNSVKVKQD